MTASLLRLPAPMGAPWNRLSLFARAQIIGWSLFALVDLVNRQLTYRDLMVAIALTVLVYPTMIGLSTGLRRIYDRRFPSTSFSPATFLAMALLSCAAAAIVVALIAAVRESFGWRIPNWRPLEEVALPFIHYAVVLFGWSILYFWIRSDRQRRIEHEAATAAQSDALRAEIQQLRLQINPHFLFNALNGIAEEVPEHPRAALAMLRDLTDYLRHVLAGIRMPVVPVEAEVTALAAYLRIQEARFGDRLRAKVEMDPAAAQLHIPNSLLQPLAENAVTHGDRSQVLELVVRIRAEGDGLRIEIVNAGRLEPTRARPGHGIGLENLQRRLDVHYPGRHSFSLRETEGEPCHPGARHVIATLLLEGEPCSAS